MAACAALAVYRWQASGYLFFALMALRDFLVCSLLLVRRAPRATGGTRDIVLAYASSFLVFLYQSAPTGVGATGYVTANTLFVVGFLLATLATLELGDRMGVSPAKRGVICNTGVYRMLKHPMYTGYIVAEVGWILLNPINAVIFVFSILGYWLRMRAENRVLNS